MRTITKTINVYRFAELSDKAKDRVRRIFEPEHDWWDSVYEMAKEDGRPRGFDIDDINFSGFYSQGDGACWVGRVDPKVYLQHWIDNQTGAPPKDYPQRLAVYEALKTGLSCETKLRIRTSGHYSHAYTMHWGEDNDVLFYDRDSMSSGDSARYAEGPYAGADAQDILNELDCNDGSAWMTAFFEEMLDAARTYADGIYCDLEKEYDYLTSDEYIAENCEANDYWFDEDGEIVDAPESATTEEAT